MTMLAFSTRSRDDVRNKARRSIRPVVDGLEDRLLMYSVTGGRFTHGARITYSFIPDGTYLGGPNNNLVSTMDASFGRAAWETAFKAAASTWSALANINLVQVPDNGATLGGPGYQQGDPNFGDIRIGGFDQGRFGTLAFAFAPPPQYGGTLASDIFFNTALPWQINHDFDLQSVAMHEFGHSLGLGHSSLNTAQMFTYYQGVRQYLTTDDSNGIRSIYGPRVADWTSQGAGNYTRSTAFDAMPYKDGLNQIILSNLSINNDQHWYKIVTPSNASTTLTAVVQSANLSLLSPRISIYGESESSGVLSQAIAPYSYGTFTGTQLFNVAPNTTYYIRTGTSNGGGSAYGAYALLINMGNENLSPAPPPNTAVASQPDQGGGQSSATNGDGRAKGIRGVIKEIDSHEQILVNIGGFKGYVDALRPKGGQIRPVNPVIGFSHPSAVAEEIDSHEQILVNIGGFKGYVDALRPKGGQIRPVNPVIGFSHPSAVARRFLGGAKIRPQQVKVTNQIEL